MRGYCAECQEYRSDNGMDAWRILWYDGLAICERCGSVVDLWMNKNSQSESESKHAGPSTTKKSGEERR